jgi:SRSO17 transposase
MTDQEFQGLGPAFSDFLTSFRDCCPQKLTRNNFDNYCRGLLSPLPRKSVEPIALACGSAVRTLQVFLADRPWDHAEMLARLQRRLANHAATVPDDGVGTIGVIDETSCRKWGDQTPGVQRQYLGCVGKLDNGIVTVHVAVARGTFQTLLTADLFLPKAWADDRERCRDAGIPDDVLYRPKWRIAFDQLQSLHDQGHRFDWLTFDEYYGRSVPFLKLLNVVGQRFVGEVPVNFAVKLRGSTRSRRISTLLTAAKAQRGRRFTVKHKTSADTVWRVAERRGQVGSETYRLVVAICESTAEVKYFVSNDLTAPLAKLLAVAFRRATIEHGFRLTKQEAGLMHFEGRHYVALQRHLILSLLVVGFVAEQTERLRGEKPAGDGRTGLPTVESVLSACLSPSQWSSDVGADLLCGSLSSAA